MLSLYGCDAPVPGAGLKYSQKKKGSDFSLPFSIDLTFALLVREDAHERAVHNEARRPEGIADRTIRGDAQGLRANQRLRPFEVSLSQSVGHQHRVIPPDQVDVPHRAVVESAPEVGHVLQDVERRLLVADGGIQA